MYTPPAKCPVCGEELTITRLHCTQCATTIEGYFENPVNTIACLSPEQVRFLLAFVRCEGRFTRLEQEMNLSYPTLRNRLNEVIRALGYEPSRDETGESGNRLSAEARQQILEDLNQGRISPSVAQNLLAGRSKENA